MRHHSFFYIKLTVILSVFLNIYTINIFAQEENLYLEDQIFISSTYNILTHKDKSIMQGGFSNGFSIGFIKDLPVNKRRNFGFGFGVNYLISNYFQNIRIRVNDEGNTTIKRMESSEFTKNKFSLSYIEMPFEIRYRTSTADENEFWRFYLGVKLGYRIKSFARLKTEISEVAYYGIPEFNKWRYGLTLNSGYDRFVVHIYYGLSNIFNKDVYAKPVLPGEPDISMKMNELNIGLIYYLL